MCLKMFGSKSVILKNPVAAIFKQLIITSFDFLDSMLRPYIDKQLKEISTGKENLDIEEDKCESKPITKLDKLDINIECLSTKDKINDKFPTKKDEEVNVKLSPFEINTNSTLPASIQTIQIINIDEKDKNNELKLQKEASYRESIDKIISTIRQSHKDFEINTSEYEDLDLYQVPLKLFKHLIQLSDGRRKEWITPTIFSKSLALELISVVINRAGWVLKYLKDFNILIKEELFKILKKNFETTNDFILGMII